MCAVGTVMCQEQIDMVAGDFNGAAWRQKSGDDQQRDSTIEEAFANTNLPIPRHCGVQETFQENGPTYVDSSSRRIQTVSGRYAVTAFEINRDVLGIRPTDQSCHHVARIHLSHANARLVDHCRARNAVRTEQDRRQGKKRGNPYGHM